MVRFATCLLILTSSVSQAKAGQLADEMVTRTISKFIDEIAVNLNESQHRDDVVNAVIGMARNQGGCLQTNQEGICLWKVAEPGIEQQESKTKRAVTDEKSRH